MMIMKKVCSLYLLFIFLSFVGFTYETLLAYIMKFEDLDRGFLSLPLCPIYGFGVLLTYLIFNTPDNLRFLKKRINVNKKISLYLYFIFSATLATLLELIVGYFFEKYFDVVLWSYNLKFDFNKYCSLIPSIIWGLAITIFMNNLFYKLYSFFYKIKKDNLISISIVITILIIIDLMHLIFLKQ